MAPAAYSRGIAVTIARLETVGLVRSRDHGIDGVDDDCDDHPEDRRQEEAASDVHDVMGVEETICIFLAGGSVG